MTDFVIVLAGADSMRFQHVEAFLENNSQEYRRVTMRILQSQNVIGYITEHFDDLWAGGEIIDASLWASAKDKDDVRRKAIQAITAITAEISSIDTDIAILDGSPSNAQIAQIVRNNAVHNRNCLVYIRKIARYLGE
jgi:hypothetical protein